ncbi:LacI family DNA-binding transcriptional regulator [Paenibacillus sp. M1]|uniref:LacI family DNA-binding transcriptional regulator n=1 Tax=Paenibacillus haidiansis TaxID=1574488 RepID=A0ABU7VM07_9BACL
MKNKVTIQEIADFVGLSKFAVSRALSGKSGVSEQTRNKILKAAGQLGYFKEGHYPTADGLELREVDPQRFSGTVLVLFPNTRFQNNDSQYWGPIIEGISTRLHQKDLNTLTLTELSGEDLFSLLNPKAIRGIITVGTISTPILLDIKQMDIPVVMIDHLDPALHCDTVFVDNFYSMKELMTKLISRGFRNFQFVGNINETVSNFERWIGFCAALDEYGIEHEQIPSLVGPGVNDSEETFMQAIREHELPEVFVCANNNAAELVIEKLNSSGFDIPGDVRVTGFDNTHEPLMLLATVIVNKKMLGMRAVDQLLWRLLNRTSHYEKLLISADVVFRELPEAVQAEPAHHPGEIG